MKKRLIFYLSVCSISEQMVTASPVQPLIPPLPKHQIGLSEPSPSTRPKDARGGAIEIGDQSVLRRFTSGGADSRMPSLFTADEAEYNRFAACLAATEGLRRMRDQALMECSSRGSSSSSYSSSGIASTSSALEEQHKIAAQYQTNSGKVLRAMGMSVEKFNELGREISQDEKLKEKVCVC